MAKRRKKPKQPRLDLRGPPGNQSLETPYEVAEVLEALDPHEKQVITQWFEVAISGPIPPPQTMAGYDQVITDGADRIMEMAEREQAHRHKHDDANSERFDKYVDNDVMLARRGQVGGLTLMSVLLLASLGFAYLEKFPAALGSVLTAVAIQVGGWALNRSTATTKPAAPPGKEKDSSKRK